jgi:hypothetical protein
VWVEVSRASIAQQATGRGSGGDGDGRKVTEFVVHSSIHAVVIGGCVVERP